MDFAWDPEKSQANALHRGFDFAFASAIFDGRTLEAIDARLDYGEVGIKAIGWAEARILVVIYTDRGSVRRIISARAASKQERALWLRSSG